jgi:transglutaminase-like putative cysteine protease
LTTWTDGFSNIVHVSVQNEQHDEIPVVVRGEVDTYETHGILPSDDGLPPLMFLRPTSYTEVDAAIDEFARGFVERLADEGPVATLHALMWALHTTVQYRAGATDVSSTAAEAIKSGFGVCQDHAHLFIACCRVLGIPARYVSGYLFDKTGDAVGELASHAWAEAHVDDLGWVSFDPSNGQSATDAYVRLAVAFDYTGASPIRGVRRGGGTEDLTVSVKVVDGQ